MCGILAIFGFKGTVYEARRLAIKIARRMRHRGPDEYGLYIDVTPNGINILAQERLSIVDTTIQGRQPFVNEKQQFAFITNGEIYNYDEIVQNFGKDYEFQGHSDSETVGVLYKKFGPDHANYFNGMFASVVYDIKTKDYYLYRDHVGIIPLYTGIGPNGERFVSSELKVIHDQCVTVEQFKPGCWMTKDGVYKQWYQPQWYNIENIPTQQVDYKEFREKMILAVKEQLSCDVPFGVLLSGGLDSSLIASIVMRIVKSGEIDINARGMKEVNSFSIGLQDSPDLANARKVAKQLGTKHHEFVFTVDEGLDYYDEVVQYVETFNPTTIRASTPMYIMARKIKAMGIKMVMTGEGADEVFGGYLYFHKAPNGKEFHQELVRKVKDLYKYDLLRANKSCLAWGVEVRPPFLHKTFLDYCMNISPEAKMPRNNERSIEKYIIRKAFDTPDDPYLPDEVLWRQKEQFSDGVGYKWIDGIKDLAEQLVSDKDFEEREKKFPLMPPFSKEMYNVRSIFSSYYPSDQCAITVGYEKSVACSTAKALEWDESFKNQHDESGRSVLGVHSSAKVMDELHKQDNGK